MTASLPPMIRFQPLVAGAPLPGGKVYFYQSGTTTPQAAYAADGTTPLANPLDLDANGAVDFRLGDLLSYKIDLTESDGTPVTGWPIDQIQGNGALIAAAMATLASTSSAALGDALIGVKSVLAGGTARTQHSKNADYVSVKDFGAVGDGVTNDTAAFQAALAATSGLALYIPAGNYKIVSDLVCNGTMAIYGDGANQTQLTFAPTALTLPMASFRSTVW